MLWKILVSMVLAYVIEVLILRALIQFFEWRFFKKADSIFMLYECVYPMIEDKFNEDKSLKVTVKFNYCNSKIKFRNSLDASIKIEILVQKALRNYYIIEFIMGMVGEDLEWTDTLAVKEELEKLCYEIRSLTSDNQEEQKQEEL